MLTYKEFLKLSDEEKRLRYKELDDHEAFMVRISDSLIGDTIGYIELSDEQKQEADNKLTEYISNHFNKNV